MSTPSTGLQSKTFFTGSVMPAVPTQRVIAQRGSLQVCIGYGARMLSSMAVCSQTYQLAADRRCTALGGILCYIAIALSGEMGVNVVQIWGS